MTVENWKQRALIKITPLGGTGIDGSIMSKDIQISGGEQDVKSDPNLAGGRMVSFVPQTDYELTLDNIQFSTADLDNLLLDASGTSAFHSRVKVRVVITWVDDPTASDAEAATTVETYRNTFVDGYVTSFDKKFSSDDGVLIGTLKVKIPVRDRDGTTGNFTSEYNASGLSAVSAYA